MQVLFGAKLFVAIRGIDAHADDFGIELLVFRDVALEVVRLQRAAAGAVFRVEIQHHPFAVKIVEADFRPVLRREREIGRHLTDLGRGSEQG